MCVMGFASVTAITQITVSLMQQTHILGLIFGSVGLIGTPLIFFFIFDKEEDEPISSGRLSDDLMVF